MATAQAQTRILRIPVGVGGLPVFGWQFATQAHHKMHGKEGGETGTDNDFVLRGFQGIGAWIIGRNMFGPVRGPWQDNNWKGWWGDNPPYRTPVFVLTNHPRAPIPMAGGTTFHFVTDGIQSALEQAVDAANGQDVRLGGGIATMRQYLRAQLIDQMHLVVSPVLLGSGERLFEGIDLPSLGYQLTDHIPTPAATHMIINRRT